MDMVINRNTENAPMIGIDNNLGYVHTPDPTGWKNVRLKT
jgi:hypothetical protein